MQYSRPILLLVILLCACRPNAEITTQTDATAPNTDSASTASTASPQKVSKEPKVMPKQARGAKELGTILTTGKWIKDLGQGPFLEQWVYKFRADGTFSQQFLSDFTTKPTKSTWKLSAVVNKKLKLTLDLNEQNHIWLGKESYLRYDSDKDVLLVSGERYSGEQKLRHEIQAQPAKPADE